MRRRSALSTHSYYRPEREASKVIVSISWDNVTNTAYKLQFTNIRGHWSKCEVVIQLIKQTIPSSQREYDPDTKTWFIGEPFIKGIKDTCDTIPDFDVIYTEKPSEVFASRMHSHEDDYREFKHMLELAHVQWTDTTDAKIAKKAYLRASMYLHPDRNPHMAAEMSTLNEVFSRLQGSYFKPSKEGVFNAQN
jgi:hypothetical protein